jgi:C-terminal processing protease CtpA/Prc
VEPGSPAENAGLERGLVVYRVGKHDVRMVAQVEKLLARANTGTAVDFTVGIMRTGDQSPRLARVTLTAR